MDSFRKITSFIENKIRKYREDIGVILLTNDKHDLLCILIDNDNDKLCIKIKPSEFTLYVNALTSWLNRRMKGDLVESSV